MFNEYTWKKSNFFAAIGMIILGILTVLSGFIFDGFVGMIVMLCLLTVYVIISLIYAYFVYKNERERVDRE
jgi:TM2 domain-containing membrane protein YozV